MNRLARLYNSETVRIVTIPAIMCRYINKLLGTINLEEEPLIRVQTI